MSLSDFRQRFVSLLSYEFRTFSPGLGISILHQGRSDVSDQESCSECVYDSGGGAVSVCVIVVELQ